MSLYVTIFVPRPILNNQVDKSYRSIETYTGYHKLWIRTPHCVFLGHLAVYKFCLEQIHTTHNSFHIPISKWTKGVNFVYMLCSSQHVLWRAAKSTWYPLSIWNVYSWVAIIWPHNLQMSAKHNTDLKLAFSNAQWSGLDKVLKSGSPVKGLIINFL